MGIKNISDKKHLKKKKIQNFINKTKLTQFTIGSAI